MVFDTNLANVMMMMIRRFENSLSEGLKFERRMMHATFALEKQDGKHGGDHRVEGSERRGQDE
jgi:hypothetical protein